MPDQRQKLDKKAVKLCSLATRFSPKVTDCLIRRHHRYTLGEMWYLMRTILEDAQLRKCLKIYCLKYTHDLMLKKSRRSRRSRLNHNRRKKTSERNRRPIRFRFDEYADTATVLLSIEYA